MADVNGGDSFRRTHTPKPPSREASFYSSISVTARQEIAVFYNSATDDERLTLEAAVLTEDDVVAAVCDYLTQHDYRVDQSCR